MGTKIEYIDGIRVEVTTGPLGEKFEEMEKAGLLKGLQGDALIRAVCDALMKEREEEVKKK